MLFTGARCPADFCNHPLLMPNNSCLSTTMANSTAASATVLQQRFIKVSQQLDIMQKEWISFTE